VFGDPDDLEGTKFFDFDKFKVTIALTTWKATVAANVNKVNP